MPKVVAGYRDQARERIVVAAQTVFRRKGFRATTMADIAREIGVSKGALYLYFRTKSELLAELQRQSRDAVLDLWRRLLLSGDVAEGIAGSVDEVLTGKVDPGIWIELLGEAAGDRTLRATLEVDAREDRRAMTEFLRELGERGRIRPLRDPETVAEIVLALLAGAVVETILHGTGSRVRRDLVRQLRFLLPPP